MSLVGLILVWHRSTQCPVPETLLGRELSVTALSKVAKHFGMTLDELVNFKGKVPTEEKIEDITSLEQLRLINELDEEDKAMVYRLIDTIVTKKKFKDFVATIQ